MPIRMVDITDEFEVPMVAVASALRDDGDENYNRAGAAQLRIP